MLASKLKQYERDLLRLISQGEQVEARDLRRIRRLFSRFIARAKESLREANVLNQASILSVLRSIAVDLDRLQSSLLGIVIDGTQAKAELNREMVALFGTTWLDRVVPITGSSAAILSAASDYSARLIGIGAGGLTAQIQAAIDNRLRLAVLGLDAGALSSKSAISAALGLGDRWTLAAETIYRTEVNRFYSLMTEASIARLHNATPMAKRWYWSGISREEHAAIHGQTVPFVVKDGPGYFRVPRRDSRTRKGAAVFIEYPRAVRDRNGAIVPGDVTVNCGCWHAPIPLAASQVEAIQIPQRTRRRRAS